MNLIATHIRSAVLCLGAGRHATICTADRFIWSLKLDAAHHCLNAALAEANRLSRSDLRARVMRMTNWIRAEKRRAV